MGSRVVVVDATKRTQKSLWEQIKENIKRIARGGNPGLVVKVFSKSELNELKPGNKRGATDPRDVADDIYRSANYRDAQYAHAGRIMMRVAGLNDKKRALFGRAQAYKFIEERKK